MDVSRMIVISSDDLIDIEQPFIVTAGPGAGKTHWLINHIKNVLENSLRLQKSRKIACITYTNVAVETILDRLGPQSVNQVEISTIHSFLYSHVIKPYIAHIAGLFDIDTQKINGHDNIEPGYSKVHSWLENHSKSEKLKHPHTIKQLLNRQENKDALFNWISRIKYSFNNDSELYLEGRESDARQLRKIVTVLESDLLSYKKLHWQEGKLDHDDVLYFSYELITRYPFTLKILRAKFPYFFIDEFQDTNPIQAKIISLLADEETIVGVIGDPAQSIYSFQGANIEEFKNFKIDNLKKYTITENRRSSNQIIDLLNELRKDISQKEHRNVDLDKPVLFIGDSLEAYNEIKKLNGEDTFIQTLSRDNPTANIMKSGSDSSMNTKVLNDFLLTDSNSKRQIIIKSAMEALEFTEHNDYKSAIKIMSVNFSDASEKEQLKKSISIIQKLISSRSSFWEEPLMTFYNLVKKYIEMPGFRKGAIQNFYNDHTYRDLALCINYNDDVSQHRTIHKSKGDEFQNVLLIANTVEFLTAPKLEDNEEHRIQYVGISRAMDRLFIVIPKLLEEDKEIIEAKFDFEIKHL